MDLIGNIVSIINALGYEEIFSYDLLGRVTEKKDREGYNTAYSYTEAGDIKSIIYNDGKSVKKNVKLEEYAYDYDLLWNKTRRYLYYPWITTGTTCERSY